MTAPLIFLPGWCVGRTPVSAAVSALNGRIIDLPGYGSEPLIADFDAAVDAIATRLQPGSALGGWSLGAQLALAVAARHPARVGKLLLVAGTPSFVQRDGWPHAMPPAMLAEFTAGIAADVEAMLPRFVGGFNRGDARAKSVTAELLQLADPRPGGRLYVYWARSGEYACGEYTALVPDRRVAFTWRTRSAPASRTCGASPRAAPRRTGTTASAAGPCGWRCRPTSLNWRSELRECVCVFFLVRACVCVCALSRICLEGRGSE